MRKKTFITVTIILAVVGFTIGYGIGNLVSKTAEGKPKESTAFELLNRVRGVE